MEQQSKNLRSFLLDILQTVVTAFGIFLIVYAFLFQPHQVKGESMYPNFEDGEYLLTDKFSYRFGTPKRGDVVVFSAPNRPKDDFIKRIIALPGETVSIKDSKIYINNESLSEDYLPSLTVTRSRNYLPEGETITLGEDEYFVLGDNRDNSSDSREWGPVKREKLVGRAWFVYWPPQLFGFIK